MTRCFWPYGEPRIHAMVIEVFRSDGALRANRIRLSLNNRAEIHGEVVLEIEPAEAPKYRIGSVYAAHFKHAPIPEVIPGCPWPEGEPRIHAVIESITAPFDWGKYVEIRFKINNRSEVKGEVSLRIPTVDAHNYTVGMTYAAHFKLVSEMS